MSDTPTFESALAKYPPAFQAELRAAAEAQGADMARFVNSEGWERAYLVMKAEYEIEHELRLDNERILLEQTQHWHDIAAGRSCGHECACPSALHHDVAALLAEWNAPIPRARITPERIMNELDAMLERSRSTPTPPPQDRT